VIKTIQLEDINEIHNFGDADP
jgi:hypothetical protein